VKALSASTPHPCSIWAHLPATHLCTAGSGAGVKSEIRQSENRLASNGLSHGWPGHLVAGCGWRELSLVACGCLSSWPHVAVYVSGVKQKHSGRVLANGVK